MDRSLMLMLIGLLPISALGQEMTANPAREVDPAPGPPGEPPYEMADREIAHNSLVDFTSVTGWVVEGHNAEGWLAPSREQRVFNDTSGKLVYWGTGEDPWLLVRPAEPIPIPEPWDSVDLWNYGNNWGWAPDPSTPVVTISAVVRSEAGDLTDIPLGWVDYKYWFLMHGRRSAALDGPLSFVGIRVAGARNTEPRTLYFGPCSFYREPLEPLSFEPQPEELPFPTRAETILPTNNASGYENRVRREGDAVVFEYDGPDTRLAYRWRPEGGGLGDITVEYQDRVIRPCAGGGPVLAPPEGGFGPGDDLAVAQLLDRRLQDDALSFRWHLRRGAAQAEVGYRIRIAGKSLIIEMESDGGSVERVALGRAENLVAPTLTKVPYLTYGGNDPRVLEDAGLFLFEQFDWYVSEASSLYGAAEVGADWASFNGGAVYGTKTDGTRNPLRERLFLTASPEFAEVLPNIPNPPSPMRDMMAHRLWRVKSGADHEAEVADAKSLRERGLEHIAVRYHEDSWRDGGESFTFRTVAGPARGGDPTLRSMVDRVKSLGWLVGLYTNYTDFAPVNANWDPDHVSRLPDWSWQHAWMRCYAPKPRWSVEMQAKLAPIIDEKFDPNHSYCDVHTAVTPFQRVDYDHRVPRAGTFRQVFECFGRLLHNEKYAYDGPVYSEGLNHWWYSGLTDGNYAQIVSAAPPQEPFLVDFDLLKMHPLQMDAGMGAPGMFFRGAPPDLDQFIATTVAYGHIGFADWHEMAGLMKLYYMHQPIQESYVMVPVDRIEYEVDGELLPTSRALASDAMRRNRVHVVYENGFQVWANGEDEEWRVGEDVLPRWGFMARGEGAAASTVLMPQDAFGGEGIAPPVKVSTAWREGSSYYADSPDGYALTERLGVEGAGALKRETDGWYAYPATAFRDLAFEPGLIGLSDGQSVGATAFGPAGVETTAPEIRWSRGRIHLLPRDTDAVRYRLEPVEGVSTSSLEAGMIAPIGATVSVRRNRPWGEATARWEWGDESRAAEVQIQGGEITAPVPAEAPSGAHLWLGIEEDGAVAWVDFIALPGVVVEAGLDSAVTLAEGEPLTLPVTVRSYLPTEVAVSLEAAGDEGVAVALGSPRLTVPVSGTAETTLRVELPWAAGEHRVELRAAAPDGMEAIAILRLSSVFARAKVADLLDLPFGRGHCRRGEDEAVGFGGVTDGAFEVTAAPAGGEVRRCLFSHPPYDGVTGYAWATFPLDLPADSPAHLEFAIGMKDGLDATDGVTFTIQVLDEEGVAEEVFSRHHAATAWETVSVDLSAYQGRRVTLKLLADAGPADNTTADHALWAEPRVVTATPTLEVTGE